MAVSTAPAGYQTLMPYLLLPNADEFSTWMVGVFEATEKMRVPGPDGHLLHGEVALGEQVIMYGPAGAEFGTQPGAFFLYVENVDTTYHKALEAKAEALTPLSDQEYGRTGGVRDPFGNTWWLNTGQ